MLCFSSGEQHTKSAKIDFPSEWRKTMKYLQLAPSLALGFALTTLIVSLVVLLQRMGWLP